MRAPRFTLMALSALVAASLPSTATTIRVPDDQPTIQAGINVASAGDTVLLMDGTFSGPGNEEIVFFGKAITVCSQSGDPSTCIVDVVSGYESGFEFLHGEGPNSVLAGVTITHAYSGVKCLSGASPSIINCVFVDNVASNGGGINCQSSASPTIVGCLFSGNIATDTNMGGGGGLSCYGACAPTVVDCEFIGNSAPGEYGGGGAIYTRGSPFPNISACTFEGNWAGMGGAIEVYEDSVLPESGLADCTFSGNWSAKWGGAIMLRETGPLAIENCQFVENYTVDGGLSSSGGAAYLGSSATALFSECSFSGNLAHYTGGAIATQSGAVISAIGCTFTDNQAGVGGAVEVFGSACTLTDCTLLGNTADGGGTAYFIMGAVGSVDGCTVVGSGAPANGGGFCCNDAAVTFSNSIIAFGSEGPAIYCREGGSATLTCCDIYGNAGGDWTYQIDEQLGVNGNICEDPLFCDAPNGDFTIDTASPCTPANNPACGLVGAWGIGCDSPVEPASWGSLKAMFR